MEFGTLAHVYPEGYVFNQLTIFILELHLLSHDCKSNVHTPRYILNIICTFQYNVQRSEKCSLDWSMSSKFCMQLNGVTHI
jgi:hypothetical protein